MSKEIADMMAGLEKLRNDMESHRATCQAVPCDRCNRVRCADCKQPFEGWDPTAQVEQGPPLCRPCERKRELRAWREGAISTLPRAFVDASLDAEWLRSLVGAQVIARAAASVAAERVAFVGLPGVGKTSLAVAMFRAHMAQAEPEVLRTGRHSLRRNFVPAQHLYVSAFALAKAQGQSALGQEAPLVTRALEAPLVLIDELGGEDPRYASSVKEVIYERHAQARPTWVTTGVGSRQIADRYGGGTSRKAFEDAVVFDLGKR